MRYSDYYREIQTILLHPQEHGMQGVCSILSRLLRDCTSQDGAEYANDAARLYTLCHKFHFPAYRLSQIWERRRLSASADTVNQDHVMVSLHTLALAVQAFTGQVIPPALLARMPQNASPSMDNSYRGNFIRRIRLSVDRWDQNYVWGQDIENPSEQTLQIRIPQAFLDLSSQLYPQAQLNLLDVHMQQDILEPQLIVLDPDFLLDITAITSCMKAYGTTPVNYLLHIFGPAPHSTALQMGNVANQFLDDAVNGSSDYMQGMKKSLHNYPLQYLTLPIDKKFFDETQNQHRNIQHTVTELMPEMGIDVQQNTIVLEPSFICEAMGLQGRMDMLCTDNNHIVELKSGQNEQFPHPTYRSEHAIQMALYKEILYFNQGIPRSSIETFLLYSRYPLFYDIRLGRESIASAMNLRNGIINLLRILRSPQAQGYIEGLTEGDFNIIQMKGRFYEQYLLPPIRNFLDTIAHASVNEKAYFFRMVRFMAREQQLARTGDDRPDSNRGFAQVWLGDTAEKVANGTILTDLRLEILTHNPVTMLRAWFPDYGRNFTPNFREGDTVILYQRDDDTQNATSGQVHRCQIRRINSNSITLELPFPQREESIFSDDHHYAIEPFFMDSTFTTAYRGLFAFLQAPQQLRTLLMGQRKPTLQDYHLIVGPPGTGKTSHTLRDLVVQKTSTMDSLKTHLLLLAYTHRAVDEICGMLQETGIRYLRIARPYNCAPQYRQNLLETIVSRHTTRQQILQELLSYPVIVSTIATMSNCSEAYSIWNFREAIIDEASQVLEPQILPIWCHLQHITMIGDHKQLPAVVTQSTRESRNNDDILRQMALTDCRNSMFERLHALALINSSPQLIHTLTTQGRMHASIGAFASRAYYDNMLDIVPLPHQTGTLSWRNLNHQDALQTFLTQHRMMCVDVNPTTHPRNNRINTDEAQMVSRIVSAYRDLYRQNHREWNDGADIGIIVPFRAQIAAIRNALDGIADNITIDTVERYQGSQRQVIIFSTTISQRYQLSLLSDENSSNIDRKLNVAVTRSREQFILVGNTRLLEQTRSYRELIQHCTKKASTLRYSPIHD